MSQNRPLGKDRPLGKSRPLGLMLSGLVLAGAAALVPSGNVVAQDAPVPSPVTPVLVTAEWVAERLDDIVLINIDRNDESFQEEHIPGAQFVSRADFISSEVPGAEMKPADEMAQAFARVGVSNDAHVVLYGGQMAAARAFLTLDYLGHTHTHVLDGGLQAWKGAGYETESGPAVVIEHDHGHFIPDVQQGVIVDSDWVTDNLQTPGITLIDARSDDEYQGEGDFGAERGLKAGHIPGAASISFRELIRSPDDARYLDIDDLVARFQEANVEPGQTLVSYCVTGMRASVVYLISRHLGFDAKLYDGSWQDWSNRDLPAVTGPEPGGH